ncbi:hypothetical protein [Amycolatopsis sp. GA6-003]|uniref:hypothetical protein n=1 Tax=Amycolatopsis sp. GA6-003 TaxID=2652444 RepID=UPI0039176675
MDELKKLFGVDLLCYILACEAGDLETPTASWSEARQSVLGQLEIIQVGVSGQEAIQQSMAVSSVILRHQSDCNTSLANLWRMRCGGEVYEVSNSADACAGLLQALARDLYPFYLMPIREDGFAHFFGPGAELYQHPLHMIFAQAVLEDSDLCKLFPGRENSGMDNIDEAAQLGSFIRFSSGAGFTYQLVMLAMQLLSAGYHRQVMLGKYGYANFVDAVTCALFDARSLARREKISTPVIVGLSGVVPLTEEVAFGECILRRVKSDDFVLLPANSGITAVLVAEVAFELLEVSKWRMGQELAVSDPGQHQKAYESWHKEIRDLVNDVRFALLCSSDGANYITARQEGLASLSPLGNGHRVHEMSRNFAGPSSELSGDQARLASEWYARISRDGGNIDIAIRRILSAVSERFDAVDGLIDAVMAWENMFSGTPETTVRVCGSLANLLESTDYPARVSLFRELKKIYNMRSKLVHGASDEPSLDDTFKARNRAIEIALSAARRVYEMEGFSVKKSAERSEMLLLWAVPHQDSAGE